ncbi:MAG: MFS transporter [Chloroflexota bacterium]
MTSIAAVSPTQLSIYWRRAVAWAIYDWANSAVVTIVIAAVFPIYFNTIAQGELGYGAASAFSFAITISLLLSAVIGPVVGTLADIIGGRKRLLIVTTLLGSVAVCGMYSLRAPYCAPTAFDQTVNFCPLTIVQTGMWVWAVVLFVVMQIFLNTALALYDALLSHIALQHDLDRLSALGYALGYVGGGLILAVGLGMILSPKTFGLPGVESATRLTLFISGVWWLIFALPLFILVPEPPASPLKTGASDGALLDTFRRMGATFREIRAYRELFKMLIAFWLYSDGIGTIIQLATTYGRQQIGLDQTVLIGALLVTQFVAFPYSIMFGRFPDKQSKNRDFFVAFILWTAITFPLMGSFAAASNASHGTTTGTTFIFIIVNQIVGLVFCWTVGRRLVAPLAERLTTKRSVIFGLVIYAVIAVWGFFLYSAAEFWMLAWLVGTVQGGTQALSRSLYSTLTPRSKSGEFFGFYGFSDKFAGILGPLLFGVIALATGGNLRISILSVVIFFVLGAILLARVDEVAGAEHAEREDAQLHYHDELPGETAT